MDTKELKDFWQGFPEAPYSDTFKWVDADGYEHMMTVRGWSGGAMLEAITKAKEAIANQGGFPVGKHAAGSSEPVRVPIDDNGNALPDIFKATAGTLSYEDKNGKLFWKIMDAKYANGKGTKYGVSIWPEVYEAAGLNLTAGQPVPDIAGWAFEYVCNEKGYPQKVTRLLPPK